MQKIDWNKPLMGAGKFHEAKTSVSFVMTATARDGVPITDGFVNMVLIGEDRRAFYCNDLGEVMDARNRLCAAVSNVPEEKPRLTASDSVDSIIILAEELRETREVITTAFADLKRFLFNLNESTRVNTDSVRAMNQSFLKSTEKLQTELGAGMLAITEKIGESLAQVQPAPTPEPAPGSKPQPKTVVHSLRELGKH